MFKGRQSLRRWKKDDYRCTVTRTLTVTRCHVVRAWVVSQSIDNHDPSQPYPLTTLKDQIYYSIFGISNDGKTKSYTVCKAYQLKKKKGDLNYLITQLEFRDYGSSPGKKMLRIHSRHTRTAI